MIMTYQTYDKNEFPINGININVSTILQNWKIHISEAPYVQVFRKYANMQTYSLADLSWMAQK